MPIKKLIKQQGGQTLIETLVAAFILTMGITAALALATYSLRATTNIKQRIVAIGLAREGIEAVKNMRDTNWLRETMSTTCYNFQSGEFNGQYNANCYPNWLTSYFDISPRTYYLSFDGSNNQFWQLTSSNRYGLNYSESDMSKGFYQATGTDVSATNSGFGRAITIAANTQIPFNNLDTGPRLTVTVDVWWTDRNCTKSNTIPVNSSCRVTLATYLTNWKTFTK